MKPYQKLMEHWRSQGLTLPVGASEGLLLEFETKYGVELTVEPDFREYLLNVNGMEQVGGQDNDINGFSFWPISRIKSIPEECQKNNVESPVFEDVRNFFVFADYLQWSWAYAICLSPLQKGAVLQLGTTSPRIVAKSFADFVEAYIQDSEQLYPP